MSEPNDDDKNNLFFVEIANVCFNTASIWLFLQHYYFEYSSEKTF